MRVRLRDGALVADLGDIHRSISSAVLGGGIGRIRSWINLGVGADYARTDPAVHVAGEAAGLAPPVVGMLTAADITRYTDASAPLARAVATVGISHPLAAAGTRPRVVPRAGTINILVVADAPLDDAGLVGALQTAVEAKAQALADAGVSALNGDGFATGTATDAICVACPPGSTRAFAGPATATGADIARAVHAAVLEGAAAARRRRSA